MKTSSAKAKGRKLQQWVRDKIQQLYTLAPSDVRSTSMGASGEDIQLSSYARKLFPYSVECKNVEKINVWTAYEQAKINTVNDETSLLIIKKNRKRPLAVIDAEAFFRLAYIESIYRLPKEEEEELRLLLKLSQIKVDDDGE